MHKRLFPKENSFSYGVYYLAFDLDELEHLEQGRLLALNKLGLLSFYDKDHGPCDGSSLKQWALDLLSKQANDLPVHKIVVVAMPRVLGYGFNPVSFWLCLDRDESLRAVIAEVHNTFDERHVYLCRNDDGSAITSAREIEAKKVFHVSPFLERSGFYRFRFDFTKDRFGVWIDYYNENGQKQLLTSLNGSFAPLNRRQILLAFISCPLVTIKTITMIHWQALKIVMKGIKYIPKPAQLIERVVLSRRITNS